MRKIATDPSQRIGLSATNRRRRARCSTVLPLPRGVARLEGVYQELDHDLEVCGTARSPLAASQPAADFAPVADEVAGLPALERGRPTPNADGLDYILA